MGTLTDGSNTSSLTRRWEVEIRGSLEAYGSASLVYTAAISRPYIGEHGRQGPTPGLAL